jgi:hypothetical protein
VSMLKKHVRVPKLHLLLEMINKVREFVRYLFDMIISNYLGLSKDDIEQHIAYVTSDENFRAKSSQC